MNLQKQLTKMLFCLIFMLFGLLNNSTAQCHYLSISNNGQSELTEIPTNFPVLDFSKATEKQKEDFKTEVEQWKSANPGFERYTFSPTESVSFITITKTDFDAYDDARQNIILANPVFYHLN